MQFAKIVVHDLVFWLTMFLGDVACFSGHVLCLQSGFEIGSQGSTLAGVAA